jgi:glycine cleavage system H protein
MTQTPAELRYIADHHWIRVTGEMTIRVGVTDFAQESLGDVVEVLLPRPDERVRAGQACGEIESVKSVNDLVAPITGTVTSRNEPVESAPELTNIDPYGEGWLFEVQGSDTALFAEELTALLDADTYRLLTGK